MHLSPLLVLLWVYIYLIGASPLLDPPNPTQNTPTLVGAYDQAESSSTKALIARKKGKGRHDPPPPYISGPNNATCIYWKAPGAIFRNDYFFINTTGDWAGHDWGHQWHGRLDGSIFKHYHYKMHCPIMSITKWRFEYLNTTGTWLDKSTRSYGMNGTGPAWASFAVRMDSICEGLIECVERSIEETIEEVTKERVDISCREMSEKDGNAYAQAYLNSIV